MENNHLIKQKRTELQKITEEIATKKAKILDDFAKAYCASRKNIDISKLELVETHSNNKITWFFRIKRGRPNLT